MSGRVIDELVTIIRYNTSNRELRRAEQQVNDFTKNTQRQFASWGQNISKITRAATVVIGALGAGAFKVGAAEERSLLNLRTQLGLTADEVEDLKAPLRDISKETNRPLKELNDAIFSVRSAGLGGADAMEVLNASAKAAASGLGDTKSIALLAGGAVNTFGSDVLGGERAVEILLGTVKEGNLNAAELANTMGKGFTFVDQLGADLAEYGASIAGYTRTAQSASAATDAVSATFRALATPSSEGAKILKEVGFSVADVRRAVKEDGFLATLDRLRTALGGNEVKLRQLLGEANAVGFALHATGEGAAEYEQILGGVRDTVGDVSQGFEIYANSSVAQADEATNNLRLALSSLYNSVLVPLLQLFGKLPSAIQTVVLGMGAMQIASAIGLGPSLGGLISSLGRFIVALKTGAIWNSNFILSLRLAAIAVRDFAVRLWTSGTAALGRFATSIRTNAIPALSRFAATIWTSSVGALKGLVTNLARASLGMLRFAFKAIVAGISAVITFGVAIWASLIPPLIAATAAVVGFTLALLANPIVLIVMAIIGAFVALGFVVYKFRRQIVGALKTALAWVKGNWPLLVGILLGPFGIVGALVWKFRDQILGAFRDVWDWLRESPIFSPVIDGIQAIIDFVRELPGRVLGILKDIPGMVADAIRDIPGLGAALEVFTGIAGKVKERFDKGGIVPGPLGRPLLATVHGGEMVLPVGASRVIAQMLEGFRLGPAALPQAPYHYGQMYRSSVVNRSVTVNINMNEPIVIHTQATDAKGIAQEIGEAIEDKIRNVAYDHDGPVER